VLVSLPWRSVTKTGGKKIKEKRKKIAKNKELKKKLGDPLCS